jgi:Uma2 family endonuclease
MSVMSLAPVPDWLFPPEGGFTAADLDRLPDLPPHTELIDGSLILVSPQASFHMRVVDLLTSALRRAAPPSLRVRREMTISLDFDQRPEPDVMVIRAEAETAGNQTTYHRGDALLAVEVVSPESRTRDRKRKPQLYAEGGIEHFWLVETELGKPVLYTHRLDPELKQTYTQTGRHEGAVKLEVPYPVEFDFAEIERM